MRTEGFQPRASASALEPPENAAVAEMDAVEIADGEGARAEIRGHLSQAAVDLHGLGRASHQDFEAIVGQPDVRRQKAFGALVPQVVTDVREEGAPRRQLFHGLDGAVHGGMRGVRLVAQRVEEKDIERAQQLERDSGMSLWSVR